MMVLLLLLLSANFQRLFRHSWCCGAIFVVVIAVVFGGVVGDVVLVLGGVVVVVFEGVVGDVFVAVVVAAYGGVGDVISIVNVVVLVFIVAVFHSFSYY